MSGTSTRIRARALVPAVVLAAALLVLFRGAAIAADDEPQWEWNDVPRIVAIGDVHGAYDNLVATLKNAGLVDDRLRWIGGKTHLVQNGDVVDRGPESRKAMDLLMDLEDKAEKAGGYVHCLIGNHEAMDIVGILDLVSKEEYESYVDRDSRRRRDNTFENYYENTRRSAKEKGEDPPKKADLKKEFEDKYPLGFIEHRKAFAADGRYGKWIMGHNAAVKIDGIVFTHGDWSEKFAQIGIAELNRRVRSELRGEVALDGGLAFDTESPLQYRGLSQTPLTREAQAAGLPRVEEILTRLDARRMVVGHTVTSGVIESRFGGRHVSIDCGMLEIYHGGHRIALEIEDNRLESVHDGGKVAVPETMDESNFEDYVRAVAAVDPENVDVQLKIIDLLEGRQRTEEAANLLQKLFEIPGRVPFRYHDQLGSYYASRGELGKAEEQYLAYIDGLAGLVNASPDNANLANLFARSCIDKNLALDRAESVLARALDDAPDNPNLLLTMARLRIAQSHYQQALALLERLQGEETLGYEVHYFEGLAYLGLDDATHARAAFERAVAMEPARAEARDELRKLDETSVNETAAPRL
jgi:Calcineurin-like phosphoesterase/Tetratricopeptide repeat